MRTRIAFQRAKQGDPTARAVVAKHYAYIAPPEQVEAALEQFDGELGELAAHLRWLAEHPVTTPPLATAIIAPQEWNSGIALTHRPNPRRGTTGTEQAVVEEEVEQEQIAHRDVAAVPGPAAVPKQEATSAPLFSPTVTVTAREPAPPSPEPRQTPAPPARRTAIPLTQPPPTVRRVRSTGTETATSSLPTGVYRRVVDVALSVAPKWQWPLYDCLHIKIADGAVVIFSRADSMAFWIVMEAETTGRASVAVPRPGASMLRRVQGKGPVSLEIHADRVSIRRDGDPVVVPAREGAVPSIPNVEVRGGVVLPRGALAASLNTEDEEVRLEYDRRRLLVGGQEVSLVYASGASSEATLAPSLLHAALRRGTDEVVTLEFGAAADPVIITSGAVTCAIAPRSREALL